MIFWSPNYHDDCHTNLGILAANPKSATTAVISSQSSAFLIKTFWKYEQQNNNEQLWKQYR